MNDKTKDVLIVVIMLVLAVALVAFPHGNRVTSLIVAIVFVWGAVHKIKDMRKK